MDGGPEALVAEPAVERAQDETQLVARFGSFLLTSPTLFKDPHSETLDEICSSLEADRRVLSVEIPQELDEGWCLIRRVYPSPAENDGLALGNDALYTLQFDQYMVASIQLPDQPADEEIPSEYIVVWDGFLVVVAWRIRQGKPVGSFEGQVVRDILGEALERIGLRLYLQGCDPDCEHKFAHTNVRFVPDSPDREDFDYAESTHWAEVDAQAPAIADTDVATDFFVDLLLAMRHFMVLKNLGQRILEIEKDGRSTLAQLMEINYRRARLPTLSIVERTRIRWQERDWHRNSRFLIARIWLDLSSIELLRREWSGDKFGFEEAVTENGKLKLFERDYADDVDRVESLDLELMRSAGHEAAERLDSRALLRVTAVAAIAGAIAGGLIGALANTGF